jgi:hypothetical protein
MEADARATWGKRKKLARSCRRSPHSREQASPPSTTKRTVSRAQNPSTANPVKSGRAVPSNCQDQCSEQGPRRCRIAAGQRCRHARGLPHYAAMGLKLERIRP